MSIGKAVRIVLLSVLFTSMAHSPAKANELACKAGVEETTFARERYALPAKNIHQLRGELEAWADEAGLRQGGSGSYDPKTRVHAWTISIGPQDKGVSISAHFTTAAKTLKLEAENVCWEEQTDWRPWWRLVNNKLRLWGYRPLQ